MLPPDLRAVLPDATAAAWPKVVAALPAGAYLAGGTAPWRCTSVIASPATSTCSSIARSTRAVSGRCWNALVT